MLLPSGDNGQRRVSAAPPTGSIRTTSAPSWRSVNPAVGAATKLDTPMTRTPCNGSVTAASSLLRRFVTGPPLCPHARGSSAHPRGQPDGTRWLVTAGKPCPAGLAGHHAENLRPGVPSTPPSVRSNDMTRAKRLLATAAVGGAVALAPTVPALAQGPIVTGGLVNVTVADVLNNNTVTVQVPVGAALHVAANVCGVAVNVLASQIGSGGPVSCTNSGGSQSVTIGRLTA